MNDYIRSSLQVLNANYPGYSFEIEEFGSFVLLWCGHQVRNENKYINSIIMKTGIMNEDLSYEKIVKEGKMLMNEINQEKLRTVVGWSNKNSHYGMWPGNKYSIAPKEIIFQDEKTTIINWNDRTKTIVKCSDDDVFSPEAGVALCYMKKFITDNDSERFHRILKSLISVSKFKNSKQEEKSSGFDKENLESQARNMLPIDLGAMYLEFQKFKKALNNLHTTEENHDIDTGTSDNSGDNDSDGSALEVES